MLLESGYQKRHKSHYIMGVVSKCLQEEKLRSKELKSNDKSESLKLLLMCEHYLKNPYAGDQRGTLAQNKFEVCQKSSTNKPKPPACTGMKP